MKGRCLASVIAAQIAEFEATLPPPDYEPPMTTPPTEANARSGMPGRFATSTGATAAGRAGITSPGAIPATPAECTNPVSAKDKEPTALRRTTGGLQALTKQQPD